jgi:hypothetical protein
MNNMTNREAVELSLEQWKKIKQYIIDKFETMPVAPSDINYFKFMFIRSGSFPIHSCYLCAVNHPHCIDCLVDWGTDDRHGAICEREGSPYLLFCKGYIKWRSTDWKSGRFQLLEGATIIVKLLEQALIRIR